MLWAGSPSWGNTGHDKASATEFFSPGRCTKDLVNLDIYDRWCCWWADQGGDELKRAVVRALWSVNSVNSLSSSMNLKWWKAENAARSSLSKAEYLTLAEESFLEKNAMGAQVPRTSCCKTPPTCVLEAYTAIEIGAFGTGWTRVGRDYSRALGEEKAEVISGNQIRVFFSASVKLPKPVLHPW